MFSSRAEAKLATMRTDVQRYGQSVVACDELLVFVSPTDAIHAQFGHIFTMAETENWSVEFRPDGTVRFAELPALLDEFRQWDNPEPSVSQAG